MYLRNVILVALVSSMAAFAQNPITADSGFQVRYAANLNVGDAWIDITNTGAQGAALLGPGFGTQAGNICVNVYTFDPGEEMISCCSCLVTPDQTVNLSAKLDLTNNTVTGVAPNSITIKLLANVATGTSCTNSAATATTGVAGMAAWGTTLHPAFPTGYATTETPFTPATLSAGELASLTGRCASILGNDSGFGICTTCRTGALGGGTLAQ